MLTRRLLLFACATAYMAICVPPSTAQGLSISGKVRSAQGPLPGATVTLSGGSAGRRITEANTAGEYSFGGLDNGPYQVTFEHAGYRSVTVRVALGYDPDSGQVNVTLQPQ